MRERQEERVYDELLLLLARSGDRRAADRLAARWQPRLMRTARRLTGEPDMALEAVQEAWTGICQGWHRLRDPASFPAWAYSILHRKCADRIRQQSLARSRYGDPDAHPPSIGPSAEDAAALDQAFAALSPEHRGAAVLFFGEGLTLAEIAAATSVPVGTVKSRLFAARKQLKSLLQGETT